MDAKPTPTTATPAAAKSTDAAAPPEDHGGPRRRAAGQKRKSNNWSQTPSSSSSKRIARNKTLASSPLPHHLHNGPITRARQSPNKVAFFSSVPTPDSLAGATESAFVRNASTVDTAKIGVQGLREDSKPPLESVIDAEFEAVRSRDQSAHIVPTPAAWFSWSKTHPLEERALASFFDGKSEKRTPDTYMEIRNFLMKKYHSDPNTQIESKDLAELDIGELDMRQEIMEFLDHWGLINFHPFPVSESDKADVKADVPAIIGSLVDKLYRFEAVLPRARLGPAADVAVPAIRPWLVPESSIVDEVRAEGPSVEYHCNSCSGDCSRKRFHCQKQADFDLCSECFSNGKFDSGMSPADFILMESVEVPGVSGGSWTDQETLLLLEALELFGENWNEIAEHVATKSKTQCILHFLQMPIEDTFLEGGDGFEISAQEKSDPVLSENHASSAKDSHETLVDKSATSNDTSTLKESTEAKMGDDHLSTLSVSAETKISKDGPSTPKESLETTLSKDAVKNDSTTANDVLETMETKNETNAEPPLSEKGDILGPKDAAELNVPPEASTATDFVINVLKEAFQAVGFFPGPGESFSFAEAGNPVMALAVYLAGLVDADMSTASAQSSLKALSEDASGIQLATRHSFILEDPPDNLKNAPASERFWT
ncbi:hypothetical protein Scep_020653 [Stephania cephalantha]|uniref:SWI/SNF complex subunit SWI3D n=1 Tax=Stephania cephalantha TaxID=152367 RepID=A0AAP0ICZ4_9MAGN